MRFIKIFFSRLFCLHQWEKDLSPTRYLNGMAVYGSGIVRSFICKRCGKLIDRFEEPVSYYKDN